MNYQMGKAKIIDDLMAEAIEWGLTRRNSN